MSQGQGNGTKRKEAGFAALFEQSLRISLADNCRGHTYWHVDLNAGTGFNDKVGCPGSPMVFLDAAAVVGREFSALFCDSNPASITELKSRVRPLFVTGFPGESASVEYFCGDNGECLRRFAREIEAAEPNPRFAVGTCLCDPNGILRVRGFPADELAEFTGRFPRIDLILNLNVNTIRAVQGCIKLGWPGFDWWPGLQTILARFNKAYWMVRNIPRVCGNSFVTLLGRNKELRSKSFLDFYATDSPTGAKILDRLRRVDTEDRLLFPDWEG